MCHPYYEIWVQEAMHHLETPITVGTTAPFEYWYFWGNLHVFYDITFVLSNKRQIEQDRIYKIKHVWHNHNWAESLPHSETREEEPPWHICEPFVCLHFWSTFSLTALKWTCYKMTDLQNQQKIKILFYFFYYYVSKHFTNNTANIVYSNTAYCIIT